MTDKDVFTDEVEELSSYRNLPRVCGYIAQMTFVFMHKNQNSGFECISQLIEMFKTMVKKQNKYENLII